MNRYYIYKLTFMNGCTYVGKHHQIKEKDNYVTSSSYYHKKGGKDILLKREIILDNLPDIETCDIMETICILCDRAENINNVNYNKGAWMNNQFDSGFSGKENGMYGKKMKDIMGEERYKALVERQKESFKKNFEEKVKNGYVPRKVKDKKRRDWTKKVREINHLIWLAHHPQQHFENKEELSKWHSEKSKKSRWYWDPVTHNEKFSQDDLMLEGWNRGRIPHEYWSEERKKSYAEKHSFNPTERMTKEAIEERSIKLKEAQKDKICYTDGKNNKFLRPGQDIPEGYYRGCTFEKTELYWSTRKKKGDKING